MMGQGGGEAMQVMYMEVEGIKIAYQVAKDAARVLWQILKFLLVSLKDAPYKKTMGRTNMKNLLMRASAGKQGTVAVTIDKRTYQEIAKDMKKHGILYNAFHPLRCGKKGSVEIIIAEKDLPMLQELLARAKERRVREDVKNGMSAEQAEKNFDENNHAETMEEFAENVGATAPEEEFEEAMQERFGEDYEDKIVDFVKYKEEKQAKNDPKAESAGMDNEKVDNLADVIQFRERADKLQQDAPVSLKFIYDPKNGKSQIVDETETHIKIAGKGLLNRETNKWESIWVSKDSIMPPLTQGAEKDGMRTVRLPKDAEVVVEDPTGKNGPKKVQAESFYKPEGWNTGTFVAEGVSYETAPASEKEKQFDITIGKTYAGQANKSQKAPPMIWAQNESAVKTRVPGTYGKDIRFLWIDKEELEDAYDGKSFLTTLDAKKEYQLYSENNQEMETVTGEELFRGHYDPVKAGTKERANKAAFSAEQGISKGRGKSL